jgi:hypothetical protein
MCGPDCVDIQTDPNHCGGCDHACLNDANDSGTVCVAGFCEPSCVAGRADCGTPAAPTSDDGCETSLNSSASCGTSCENVVGCGLGANCTNSLCRNQGVVVATVNLTVANEGQRFNLLHRGPPNEAPVLNLADTSVVIRAWAPGAINGQMRVFFWSNGTESTVTTPAFLAPFTDFDQGFFDMTVPVPPAGGGFDPAQVGLIRVEIESGPMGPWQMPSTIVYIDSITSLNGILNDTFDTNPVAGLFSHSGARPTTVISPQAGWLQTLP